MDSNALKQFVIDNRLRERTISSFWKCFEGYQEEEPEEFAEVFGEFDKKMLDLSFEKVTLAIRYWDKFEYDEYNENHEHVEAYLSMTYNDQTIGYYKLLFNFSGEVFDDFFVIE